MKANAKFRAQGGFTLIELLVVIAIIAILASMLIVFALSSVACSGFCPRSSGIVWICCFCDRKIGERQTEMCNQTSIRRIHLDCRPEKGLGLRWPLDRLGVGDGRTDRPAGVASARRAAVRSLPAGAAAADGAAANACGAAPAAVAAATVGRALAAERWKGPRKGVSRAAPARPARGLETESRRPPSSQTSFPPIS